MIPSTGQTRWQKIYILGMDLTTQFKRLDIKKEMHIATIPEVISIS
ncbi:hypothetical protein EMIT079MI2_160037 [Bacillus sp. IT-79MI2]